MTYSSFGSLVDRSNSSSRPEISAPGGRLSVTLPVQPDEHLALREVGPVYVPRRVRPRPLLEHHRGEPQRRDGPRYRAPLISELPQRGTDEHPQTPVRSPDDRLILLPFAHRTPPLLSLDAASSPTDLISAFSLLDCPCGPRVERAVQDGVLGEGPGFWLRVWCSSQEPDGPDGVGGNDGLVRVIAGLDRLQAVVRGGRQHRAPRGGCPGRETGPPVLRKGTRQSRHPAFGRPR